MSNNYMDAADEIMDKLSEWDWKDGKDKLELLVEDEDYFSDILIDNDIEFYYDDWVDTFGKIIVDLYYKSLKRTQIDGIEDWDTKFDDKLMKKISRLIKTYTW